MSAISKILIIIGLNFSGLALLIYRLLQDGNQYPVALRIAWDWIIYQNKTNLLVNPKPPILWTLLLSKTWWLMLLLSAITWVNSPEWALALVLLLLIILHIYWYLKGHAFQSEQFERILSLNQNWGIIYKEINEASGVNSKTLAELDLRKKNLLVLAIERQGQLTPFPKGVEVLTSGDRMVMFGDLYSFHSIFENENEGKTVAAEPNL